MKSALFYGSVESMAVEATTSAEALLAMPQDYISVDSDVTLALAKVTIFGQNRPLASINFDADQLDILISRIVAARDVLSGRK